MCTPLLQPGALSLPRMRRPGPRRPAPPVCLHGCSAGRARLSSSASLALGSSPATSVPQKLTSVASAVPSLFPLRVCGPQLSATGWPWTASAFRAWRTVEGATGHHKRSSAHSAGSEGEAGLEAEVCLVGSREGAQERGRTAVTVGGSLHADATLLPEACQGQQAILLSFLEALQSERARSPSDLTHGHAGCLGLLDSSVEGAQ